MSTKGSHRLSFAKHVYLRTQQRRLRHVKNVVVRNLSLELEDRTDPLNLQLHFTIHPLYDEDKTLYKSETISHSYNPSWESVQFTTPVFGKHSSLSMFTIKIWVRPTSPSPSPSSSTNSPLHTNTSGSGLGGHAHTPKEDSENRARLVFERSIDLADLVYLGTLVVKDGSGYPSNSLVIGMFEGYYSEAGVGGVPAHPPISHSLVDLLPPCSLLEVPRSEVQDSYFNHTLQRTLSRQEVLNKATVDCNRSKVKVRGYLREQEDYFRKKKEKESLKMRVALLQRQIQQQERMEKEESEGLSKQKEGLDSFESDLRGQQAELKKDIGQYETNLYTHRQHMEKLAHTRKSCILRQRNMVYELSQTFFIKEVKDVFTICNVILPNADQLDQTSNMEHFGVALGFAAHLVSHLSKILLVPLQYPIKPSGSRCTISDHISEEVIIDTIKEFPLYLKGSEKALFLYGVHLLNKDIGQIRQHCGFGGSRSMLKKTLPNLKYLMDELIKDFFVIAKPQQLSPSLATPTWNSTQPIDTAAINNAMMQNGRFRDSLDRERLSMMSSRSSSLATTATMGLSLTPPTPESLPVIAADHENFHTMLLPQEGGARQQPVANGEPGGVVTDVEGGAGDVSGSGMQNGRVGGLEVGLFRPRSGHVAGGHPLDHRPGVGGSSHEQLHYEVSVESKGGDLQELKIQDLEQPGSQDQSPTPTPPSSFQEQQQLERYLLEQNTNISKQQDSRHNQIHFGQQTQDKSMREASPAGAGLFVPLLSSECIAKGTEGVSEGMQGTGGTPDINRDDDATPMGHKTLEDEILTNPTINTQRETITSQRDSVRSSSGVLYTSSAMSEEPLDFNNETSLEFSKVMRSSQLVDSSETQLRRARAESRQHNLPPDADFLESLSPRNVTGSVSFTASGFSRVSPSEHEIRASTPTGHDTGGDPSSMQVPQVFVQHSLSPVGPEESGIAPISPVSLAAAGDSTNKRDSDSSWSSLGLSRGDPTSLGSLADEFSDVAGVSHASGSADVPALSDGGNVGMVKESEPSPPSVRNDSRKDVELVDINTFPPTNKPLPLVQMKEQLTSPVHRNTNTTPVTITDPITPSSIDLTSSPHPCPAPSPSPPMLSFPHSPKMYRSSMATPHVLGGPDDMDTYRPRARSNRVEMGSRPPTLKVGKGGVARSRSQSEEEKTEFLEDFIDNF